MQSLCQTQVPCSRLGDVSSWAFPAPVCKDFSFRDSKPPNLAKLEMQSPSWGKARGPLGPTRRSRADAASHAPGSCSQHSRLESVSCVVLFSARGLVPASTLQIYWDVDLVGPGTDRGSRCLGLWASDLSPANDQR